MPPELNGVPWDQMTLAHLEAVLADSSEETLYWEAKGDSSRERVGPGTVTKAVCAFANSERGGYLILGATKAPGGGYRLSGLEFPPAGELGSWVDQIITNGGVRPRPWMDHRTWPQHPGVAIIAIDPVGEKPAITNSGAVYRRTSGRSPAVIEPGELARLFASGTAARDDATARARAALEAIEDEIQPSVGNRPRGLTLFAIGGAATDPAPDREVIFGEGYRTEIESLARTLRTDPYLPSGPITTERQDALVVHVPSFDGHSRIVRVGWDGSVAVLILADFEPRSIMDTTARPELLAAAWRVATGALAAIGERGHVRVEIAVVRGRAGADPVVVSRWSDLGGPAEAEVAHVIAELRRSRP